MSTRLLIVESPHKARTLQRYLGQGWVVRATGGHVRDLPQGRLAIDRQDGYRPEWQTLRGKGAVLQALAREARTAAQVILATDPDREGEAIAWHVAEELGLEGRALRALVREISPAALERAIAEAKPLDRARYEAQQARRILDRIVGFGLAPLLRAGVGQGLSAGRVQSLALRLLVERDARRGAFAGSSTWQVELTLRAGRRRLRASLPAVDRAEAEAIAASIAEGEAVLESVEEEPLERRPPPPFTTARLQEEAFQRLRMPLAKSMRLAQRLFEGVELGPAGPVSLITYPRTDSPRVGEAAVAAARAFLAERLGADAVPARVSLPAAGRWSQDAHEAIRPAALELTPEVVREHLERDPARLYQLIWRRHAGALLAPASYRQLRGRGQAGGREFTFEGAVLEAPGFLEVWEGDDGPMAGEDPAGALLASLQRLPPLHAGDRLAVLGAEAQEIPAAPPPAHTEASLLVELERLGAGRPSTWTHVVETLVDRGMATRQGGALHATEIGEAVVGLLLRDVPELIDPGLTQSLEEELESIEAGRRDWVEVVRTFHEPFEARVQRARERLGGGAQRGLTEETCPRCGAALALRWGRSGPFLSCSGYPDCRFATELAHKRTQQGPGQRVAPTTRGSCPRCGSDLVERRGRSGPFLACSGWPACRTTLPVSTGVRCPACKEGEIAEKRSRRGSVFFGCNRYPACDHTLRERPVPRPCPRCGADWLVQRFSRREGGVLACVAEGCGHRQNLAEAWGEER